MSASRLASGEFHGVTTRRAIAGDLLLVETRYAPGVSVAPHWHERPYFCYLVRGTFDERSGPRSRRCGPGSLIFHPAGETHTDRFGERGGLCFNIEAAPSLLRGLDSFEFKQFGAGAANRLAGQMCREFRQPAPSELILEGLGLALIGEACRSSASLRERAQPPEWLPRAVDVLHDRFREPISLATVAAELGLHAVHLARTFRRHRGITVGEYIRALRIDFACAELIGGRRTIAEIAHASGFADHAHFCRCFRDRIGTSPSRFRALHSSH